MIAALKNWQEYLCGNDCLQSAQLLKIAELDLQLKLNGISDNELRAFCDVILSAHAAQPDKARANKLGPHFNEARSLTPAQNVIMMESVRATLVGKTKNWD